MSSDDLIQQIADLRREVAALRRERVTHRAAVVVSSDPVSSTFVADVAGAGLLSGVPAPAEFLPEPGDVVALQLDGATPIYQPSRIATELIGKTVTGGLVRTAPDGQRVEVEQVGGVGAVRMWSQDADTDPATLDATVIDGSRTVRLSFSTDPVTGVVTGGSFGLLPSGAAYIDADGGIDLIGDTYVAGSLRLAGYPTDDSDAAPKLYVDGEVQEADYATGWSAYGAGFTPWIVSKIGYKVSIYGTAKNDNLYSVPALVATLPVGWRPQTIAMADGMRSDSATPNPARYDVQPDGQIFSRPAGVIPAGSYHSIDVTFDVRF